MVRVIFTRKILVIVRIELHTCGILHMQFNNSLFAMSGKVIIYFTSSTFEDFNKLPCTSFIIAIVVRFPIISRCAPIS